MSPNRDSTRASDAVPLTPKAEDLPSPPQPARLRILTVKDEFNLGKNRIANPRRSGAQSAPQISQIPSQVHKFEHKDLCHDDSGSQHTVESLCLPNEPPKAYSANDINKQQGKMPPSFDELKRFSIQRTQAACLEWNEKDPLLGRRASKTGNPIIDLAGAAATKFEDTKTSLHEFHDSLKTTTWTAPNSPGVQKLENLNRNQHNPMVAYVNEPIKHARAKALFNKSKRIGCFVARGFRHHRQAIDEQDEEHPRYWDHGSSVDDPNRAQSIPADRRREIKEWVTGEQVTNESTAMVDSLIPQVQSIMALTTDNLKKIRGAEFRIEEGRFNFTHCPGLLDQMFYVGPPPSEVTLDEDEQLPSYFRRFDFKGQDFDVVPIPREECDPPYEPKGPHRRTGLELQGAVGDCIGGDESIVPNPGGNTVTNAGFHLFLQSDENNLEHIDPKLYVSDSYRISLFEEKEPERFKKVLWHDLGRVPSSSSSSSVTSDGYAPSFEPNVLTECRGQTPASAMILYLHQRGWTSSQIAQKLGPLDENFLFLSESAWYRGKRLPDVNGLSLELVDRICEHACKEPESWELPSDKLTPRAWKMVAWRSRDRQVSYHLKMVVENYLWWRLMGYHLHKAMPTCSRTTKWAVS